MKKSIAVLGALGAFASAALAQSSVTVYGRVDQSIAQRSNSVAKWEIRNGSASRLGFRGVEDLGGGLKALFHLEHRFDAQSGAQSNKDSFWHGKSIVGLEGGFGRLALGRESNPDYSLNGGPFDPWYCDTVASNCDIITGTIATIRSASSITYTYANGGLTVGAQTADKDAVHNKSPGSGGTLDKRPYSVGARYAAGPVTVAFGHQNPTDKDDNWTSVSGNYDFDVVRLGAFYGTGKNVAAQKVQSYLLSATAPLGSGQLRVTYGQVKNKDVAVNPVLRKQLGLGYFYFLSKRTMLYTDFVADRRDGMAADRKKNGLDFGLRHDF